MKTSAVLIVAGLMFCSAIAAGVSLVMHGHPWFGLLCFMLTGCLNVRVRDSDSSKGDPKP